MTTEEAWEIYEDGKGKVGKPTSKYKLAEGHLLKEGALSADSGGNSQTGKEPKKPDLKMNLIENPSETPHYTRVEIYKEALKYIADKRNFSFDYFLRGSYGLTSTDCREWEQNAEIARLRTIATELTEHKLIDSAADKWGGGNPLILMFLLKSLYGYNDKGDDGAIRMDADISIKADTDDSDFVDIDIYDDTEELEYDHERQVE